jgi:tryptophan synthase beta subunit
MKKDDIIVVTLSGRGDKDVEIVQDYLNKNNTKKKTKNEK